MNYYRRYSGDYLRDTARLNLTEHGAYSLLMDYYYTEEKPLPLDREEIYLMVRAMRQDDRAAVDKVLGIYFTQEPDGYHQKRIDHEIEVSQTARQNGGKGGRPKTHDKTGSGTGNITGQGTTGKTGDVTGEGGGSGHPPASNHQPPTATRQPPSIPPADAGGAKPSAVAPDCPHQAILDLYHRILPMGRQVAEWNEKRASLLKTRWREKKGRQSIEWWERFFQHIAKSDFLTGRKHTPGRDPFEISLPWILESRNFLEIIEGKYNR